MYACRRKGGSNHNFGTVAAAVVVTLRCRYVLHAASWEDWLVSYRKSLWFMTPPWPTRSPPTTFPSSAASPSPYLLLFCHMCVYFTIYYSTGKRRRFWVLLRYSLTRDIDRSSGGGLELGSLSSLEKITACMQLLRETDTLNKFSKSHPAPLPSP